MDQVTAARAFAGPGMDTRQWFSYGTVDKDDPKTGARSVVFVDKDGNPNPYGPQVMVTLQPTGISLPCRVAGAVAGDGEADWYPFVAGDEVIVALPEGDERAGAVIVGRLNQEIDAFPLVVAGQDATKNVFGFRRMRTPFVIETAASYLIRSALTGSQIGIDSEGKVIINDGDRGSLTIGPESIGISSGDEESFVTVLPGDTEVYMGAGSTTLLLSESESKFISQAAVSFATTGGSANGTAVTAEQVVAFVINVLAQLATTGCLAGPLATGAYNAALPASAVSAIVAVLQPALVALATPTPFAGPPAGMFTPFVGTLFGPGSALQAASANPLAPIDPTGTILGFSRPGFKL